MDLEKRWRTRNAVLRTIYHLISPTTWCFVVIFIRDCEFAKYGLAMYGMKMAHGMTENDLWAIFLKHSVVPVLWWLPLALLADYCLIRFLTRQIFR